MYNKEKNLIELKPNPNHVLEVQEYDTVFYIRCNKEASEMFFNGEGWDLFNALGNLMAEDESIKNMFFKLVEDFEKFKALK